MKLGKTVKIEAEWQISTHTHGEDDNQIKPRKIIDDYINIHTAMGN